MVASGQAFLFQVISMDGNLAILYASAITAATTIGWFTVVRLTGPVFFS